MTFANLPGVKITKNDGNLAPEASSSAPRVLIVGTAAKGRSDQVVVVPTTSVAKAEFGNEGTLVRGMWEAFKSGAKEVALYRIGSTSAVLAHIGDSAGTAGYTITTTEQDDEAGANYSMYYDDTTNRIVVRRNSDYRIVYDNSSTTPIDLFEVNVSGWRAAAGGPDIGSASGFVTLEEVDPSVYAGIAYTAGTDGLSLSRMEMYEQLYVAYKNLLSEEFDVIVPMDVYLDDLNTMAQGWYWGAFAPLAPSANTYPTAGSFKLGAGGDVDSLGRVFIEEYLGEYYFFWTFAWNGSTADIYPDGIGSASSTKKIDNTPLTADDFHEVNFAYQLGRFLYDYSTDIVDATGVIGVLPPKSNSLADKARWLGTSPTWTLDYETGQYYIASSGDNGNGLLGNKFMVGMAAHRSGAFGGGFILTDTEFMDGTEVIDDN
jgi:hypothetical protein